MHVRLARSHVDRAQPFTARDRIALPMKVGFGVLLEPAAWAGASHPLTQRDRFAAGCRGAARALAWLTGALLGEFAAQGDSRPRKVGNAVRKRTTPSWSTYELRRCVQRTATCRESSHRAIVP